MDSERYSTVIKTYEELCQEWERTRLAAGEHYIREMADIERNFRGGGGFGAQVKWSDLELLLDIIALRIGDHESKISYEEQARRDHG